MSKAALKIVPPQPAWNTPLSPEESAELERRRAETEALNERYRQKLAARERLSSPVEERRYSPPSTDEERQAALEAAQARLADAEKESARLRGIADAAKSAAEKAEQAFDDSPNKKTFMAHSIAAKKSENAVREWTSHKLRVLDMSARDVRLASEAIEREELRRRLAWSQVEAVISRLQSAIIQCGREMTDASRDLSRLLMERHESAARARELGLPMAAPSFGDLIAGIASYVSGELYDPLTPRDLQSVRIVFGGSGDNTTVCVELVRPAPVIQAVR